MITIDMKKNREGIFVAGSINEIRALSNEEFDRVINEVTPNYTNSKNKEKISYNN